LTSALCECADEFLNLSEIGPLVRKVFRGSRTVAPLIHSAGASARVKAALRRFAALTHAERSRVQLLSERCRITDASNLAQWVPVRDAALRQGMQAEVEA
jgi:hypothetical protein